MRINVFNKKNNHRAFSLIELVVAMSIFIIVITTVIGVFGSVISTKRKAKNVQQNLENMKYAMELMAKSIRMSSKTNYIGSNQTIFMYNNSEGNCISYRFVAGNFLERGVSGDNDYNDCTGSSTFNYLPIAPNVTGKFLVIPSDDSPKNMGKATISIVVNTGSGSSLDTIQSQTTVSLRAYDEVGI